MDYSLASESTALNKNGFTSIVDILPGQAVVLEKGGGLIFKEIVERKTYTPDILECIYLAKPDSCIDGISVYESRKNMGRKLANRMRQVLGEAAIEEIDVGMSAQIVQQCLQHLQIKSKALLTDSLVVPIPEVRATLQTRSQQYC